MVHLLRLMTQVGPRRNPVDVPFVIRHRLEELGLEQQDLARAARVTESYISQLLTRKKAPPASNRTDIYARIDKFLKLPTGEMAKLSDLQRKEELKRELGDALAPLFHEVRELVLRKCNPQRREHVRAIFEKQPFGELERLVTQTLLDVVKRAAKNELENDYWLRMVAQLSGAAMRRRGSSCSSSSIRTSSTCPRRTASRSWIRSLNPGTSTSRRSVWRLS